jgi:hypothetical protein
LVIVARPRQAKQPRTEPRYNNNSLECSLNAKYLKIKLKSKLNTYILKKVNKYTTIINTALPENYTLLGPNTFMVATTSPQGRRLGINYKPTAQSGASTHSRKRKLGRCPETSILAEILDM